MTRYYVRDQAGWRPLTKGEGPQLTQLNDEDEWEPVLVPERVE